MMLMICMQSLTQNIASRVVIMSLAMSDPTNSCFHAFSVNGGKLDKGHPMK